MVTSVLELPHGVEAPSVPGVPREKPSMFERFMQPPVLVVAGMALSALAWALPSGWLDLGFSVRADLTAQAVVVLGFWALATVLVTLVGTRIGQSVRVVERWDDIGPARLLTWLTLIATVGVIYSMYLAFSAVPVLDALLQRSGNAVSDAIPEAAGLQTLRYAATASAAVAVNELVNKRGRWPLVVWNSLLLGCVVLLQSRLSLVLSGFILLYLNRARIRGGLGKLTAIVLSAVLFMFAVTVPVNYVRNANYYEARGVSNPLAMNASQIVAYLGTPTQVAVGMADALYRLDYQPADPHAGDPLIPTYLLPDREQTYVGGSSRYAPDTDVQSNFTTNSVFADTFRLHGLAGLATALLGAFGAAVLAGHFSRYRGYLALVSAVLLYGFAEWWRTYLFNAGVLHFVCLAVLGAAIISRRRPGESARGLRANRTLRTARAPLLNTRQVPSEAC